jgi:hypothetical protein
MPLQEVLPMLSCIAPRGRAGIYARVKLLKKSASAAEVMDSAQARKNVILPKLKRRTPA